MQTQKSPFEAHDLTPASELSNSGNTKYGGPERRRFHRRQNQERRAEVRFEIKSSDRREDPGRRQNDNHCTYW